MARQFLGNIKGPKGDPGENATTTNLASSSENGLMSNTDWKKLLSIESGAQRNTVTSVNGKTGAVTIPTVDLSPYVTKTDAQQTYQPKGNYQAAGNYVESTDILKIKVVSSIPSTGEPNTFYLIKE